MDKKESSEKRKDLIETPTNTDESVVAETSKRKHQQDGTDDPSDEDANARQVKKIRLVVSTEQDNHGPQAVDPPVAISPAVLQQRALTNPEEIQSNEEEFCQIDIKELKQTKPPTPSEGDDAKAKEPNNLESPSLEQNVETTKPVKDNIPEDISELSASTTPIEFISPPEPLFPDLDLNFSPSSTNLIDALLQTVDEIKDELQTISTGTASPTHDNVISSEAITSPSQIIKKKDSPPGARPVIEAHERVVAPSEASIPSTDTESKANTNENEFEQVSKKRQTLHDDEHDQSPSAQAEPIEERKIKKIKVNYQEPLPSEPSSSKPITEDKAKMTPRPSTPTSRKGKERATAIIDDEKEEPATNSDVGQQEPVSFDEQGYEDLLLEQELQCQSRSDKKRYLMQQESLLVYYKSISQSSNSDSSSSDSVSESSSLEVSNTQKKSNSEESYSSEHKESSSESPPSPSLSPATLNEPSVSDNTNDEGLVKSPPSNSETSPDETSNCNTTSDASALVETTSSPTSNAAPVLELTSPNGTKSGISLLPPTPTDQNNDNTPPPERLPLPPFKNLATRKTTPDGQRSYITEFICITNNGIIPVSIASTNSDIINRNEVPTPEPFTMQELKLPPRVKLKLTVTAPTPTIPAVEPKKASGGSNSSGTPPAIRKRKQLMPSLKQQEINLRKERERLKPPQGIHHRLRGSNLENSQSTSASGTTENNPAAATTTTTAQPTNSTGDTLSDESTPSTNTATPPPPSATVAAGQQRSSNEKTKKLLTLDDILKNMHR